MLDQMTLGKNILKETKTNYRTWIMWINFLYHFENRDLSQSDRAKYGILDNLVRFSFGVEDFEDLKADILQALEAI